MPNISKDYKIQLVLAKYLLDYTLYTISLVVFLLLVEYANSRVLILPLNTDILHSYTINSCFGYNTKSRVPITSLLLLRVGYLILFPSNSRSEEHTSELQSLTNLVCRLL